LSRSLLTALTGAIAAVALLAAPLTAGAQEKPIRIGVLYDHSGPFAAAGSVPGAIGTQIAIDLVNEKGGVLGKHKIETVDADSQSKADVAINEAERLLNQEKVDILLGVFSSAHAVPLAAKVDAQKKIFWITIAVASAVMKDRNLQYTFRGQVHSDQYGEASPAFIAENAKSKFGMEPKDVKVAIIYEDGPYGTGIAAANEIGVKKYGLQIVFKEGYSANAADLSALVTKLRRARPDVILHTGYNPDITLFLRQAREGGLRWKALIGHGAGYAQIDKLRETFGDDVEYLYNVDPVAAQLLDPKTLAPGMGDLIKVMVERYKAKTGAKEVPPHVSMGFNQTWVLLDKVLPLAIEKHGGWDAEAIRKAALEVDIPEGGTIQGYGVKFAPPGDPMAGQNLRSSPVVMQYVKGQTFVAWPAKIKTIDTVLPLPASHPYAAR
jgi:branched-chain amino acid transport system substrate-binding protein